MNHFLSITDLSTEELLQLLERAEFFRMQRDQNISHQKILQGKNLGMFFEKPSLRTKISFEAAVNSLGGNALWIDGRDVSGTRESIEDIANNLTRFVDGIFGRVYSHEILVRIASIATVPVINALCDDFHPMQTLADLQVMKWSFGEEFRNKKVAFIGDGCNVPTSLAQGCAMLGIDFSIASPKGYEIPKGHWEEIQELAFKSGAQVHQLVNPYEAVEGANVVSTDTWVSMGKEEEKEKRIQEFAGYMVDREMMAMAEEDAIFLHCLPAYRNIEVSSGVIDGEQSKVFNQAECRMHTAKAILEYFYAA